MPRVVVFGAPGRVLGATPKISRRQQARLARHPLVRAALRGEKGVSNVFTAAGGVRAFYVAIPFHTKYGARVLLRANPVAALQGALSGYLPSAPAVRAGRAYLTDARWRVLAASTGQGLGKRLPDAALLTALRDSTSGTYAGRYFVSVPTGHNGWQAVFTAPLEALYAPVKGSRSAIVGCSSQRSRWRCSPCWRWERLRCTDRHDSRHERLHDPLTGLPTRVLFIDRVDRGLAGVHRHELPAAVLFIDLDRFKHVNDRFGQVLREVARRLRECVRWLDTLGRLGGDEFLVLCEELRDDGEAEQIAARIQRALSHRVTIGRHAVSVGCSIGIALHRPGDTPVSAASLVHDADVAMYHAKRCGRSRTEVFEVALQADLEVPDLEDVVASDRTLG